MSDEDCERFQQEVNTHSLIDKLVESHAGDLTVDLILNYGIFKIMINTDSQSDHSYKAFSRSGIAVHKILAYQEN